MSLLRSVIRASLLLWITGACSSPSSSPSDDTIRISGYVQRLLEEHVRLEFLDDNVIDVTTEHILIPVQADGAFDTLISTYQPIRTRIAHGDYFHELVLLPGDELSVQLNGDDITFQGEGAAANRFLYTLEQDDLWNPSLYRLVQQPNMQGTALLDTLLWLREKRQDALRQWSGDELPEEFVHYFTIDNEVIYEDLLLRATGSRPAYGDAPAEYTRVHSLAGVADDRRLVSPTYLPMLNHLLMKKISQVQSSDSRPANEIGLSFVLDSLAGKTQEYALASWLSYTVAHGTLDSTVYQKFRALAKDTLAIRTVEAQLAQHQRRQSYIGQPPPPAMMNTLLEDTAGNEFTFGEMLDTYREKVVYLNIWSMSHPSSQRLIRRGNRLREKLADAPVEFVHVSVDPYTERYWSQAFNFSRTKANHYRLKYEMAAPLFRMLNVDWVPYYITFDKEGRIAELDSRPPETMRWEARETVEQKLKNLAQGTITQRAE